ncbi:MAG: extracellular solute-binding protein [Verrucomicrobiota bacterium]|nr:extracellular solute-binding protein [Verrucomicrobiota bacterium]
MISNRHIRWNRLYRRAFHRLAVVGLLLAGAVFSPVLHAQSPRTETTTGQPSAPARQTLRILNWRYYIDFDDDLPEDLPAEERSPTLRDFAEKFNCDIEYHEFDDFEDMSRKFSAIPGFHDIMMLSCTHTTSLVETGWLLTIPPEKIPNAVYLDTAVRYPPSDPSGTHLIPYLNDYMGILYRNDKIRLDSLSWNQFFDPPAEWAGHMALMDYGPDMFASTLIAGGVKEVDKATREQIQQAQARIEHLAKNFFPVLADSPEDMMVADEAIWIAPVYASNAAQVLRDNPQLSFFLPSGGTDYYHDYMVIHRETQHPDLAIAFLNYLLEPDVMGRISAYVNGDAPSAAARAIRNRLDPPLVPSATDANGAPLPGMQVRYTFEPLYELLWVQAVADLQD